MPVQLQYNLQRSQPLSALSYPHPRSASSRRSSKGKGAMVNLPSRNPEYITKDYYATAYSPTSNWSSGSSDDSDNESLLDEFSFDDMESESLTLSSRASTSSAMPSPQLCTCNTSRKSSFTVGDTTFSNEADYNEYLDLVRSQTRNIAKRRASSSAQQSFIPSQASSSEFESRGRRRQRHLRKLEEEQDYQDEVIFPQANSVPDLDYNRHTASDYTSSFEPSLLAFKLEALLTTSPSYSPNFPETDSLPSLDLEEDGHEYETDEETDIEEGHELVRVQSHPAQAEDVLKQAPHSEGRFERALAFAKWNKRGRFGVWESPEGISETVRDLVATVEGQS